MDWIEKNIHENLTQHTNAGIEFEFCQTETKHMAYATNARLSNGME